MSGNRDKKILSHIIQYCEQIEETVNLFGSDYDILLGIIPFVMPVVCVSYR